YNQMLIRAGSDKEFVDNPGQLVGVRVRLVNCRRLQGNYQGAEDVLFAVLEERPTALEAQIEAARLYERWADDGTGDTIQNLQYGINGRKGPAEVWGWSLIAQKLQRSIDFGQAEENYEAMHRDAPYHLAKCQLELGKEQTSSEEHEKYLTDAKLGLQRFVAITPDIPEPDWKRLDALHSEMLEGQGGPPAPLQRVGTVAAASGAEAHPAGDAAAPAAAVAPAQASTAEADDGSSNWLMIILCVVLGLGATGGIYMMTVQQEKKRRARFAAVAKATPPAPR